MANKIKGLTIEIGGETTLLQKSMGEVNKKTKDLKTELKDVERLLKLDPGNTDLIAQKQKILADSIGQTKDKLEQLKEAEKQAQEQFAKGDISEEQYRALQREVIKTEVDLKKLEQTSKDFGTNLSRDLEAAGKSMQDFGGKITGAGKALTPLSVGAAGLLTGLVANVSATKEYREEMGKLETAFTTSGHSVEDAKEVYEGFYGVLGEEDRTVEAVSHLAKLTTTQEELAEWTTIATGVYATFGDSLPIEGLTEASNETAKTGELTGVLTDALTWAGVSEDEFRTKLEATNTEKERSELITSTLNGLYAESAEKYREVNAETIQANETQSKLNDAMATMGEVLQPIITEVLTALTKGLQGVADWVASLDEKTLKMILTILAVVAGLAPLLIIIGQVITAVGTITAVLPVLGTAFAFLTGPIGIAIAAIAAVIAIGVLLYKNWDVVKEKAAQLWEFLKQKFNDIKDAILKPINNAIDTLKNINLVDVGKNIIQGLINGIGSMISKVKSKISDIASTVTGGIKKALRISSPSKVTEEMGEQTGEGFAIGIENSLKNISKQTQAMSDISVNGATGNVSASNASVNHSGVIRVEGVNNSGELSAVVDIVMDQLRREVRMA